MNNGKDLLTTGEFERTITRIEKVWTDSLNRIETNIRDGFVRINGQLARHSQNIHDHSQTFVDHGTRIGQLEEIVDHLQAAPQTAHIVPTNDPNVIKITATKTLVTGLGFFAVIINVIGTIVLTILAKKFAFLSELFK